MSKYSLEFKLKVVKEYLEGKTGGYISIAKKYDLTSDSLIRYWVNNYEKYREEGLKRKSSKTFYSGDFKLSYIISNSLFIMCPG